MPRKLPWETSRSAARSRPILPLSTPDRSPKRQVLETTGPGSYSRGSLPPLENTHATTEHARPPSTSPPPGPPAESFMKCGMEYDDKYRMVEDEFLSVAQQFTAHLHAAEYKRQEKLAKAHNAEAINSISRPIMGKVPDETSRKLASVSLSKTQRQFLEGYASDDSDDADNLPYVGTTLHGLMDSPRKAASLLKIGSIESTTRAAAGFTEPSADRKLAVHSTFSIPGAIHAPAHRSITETEPHSLTLSSDDDDNLDAPAPAPIPRLVPNRNPIIKSEPIPDTVSSMRPYHNDKMAASQSRNIRENNASSSGKTHSRVAKPDHVRRQKVKQELEQQERKKLDEIPIFL